MTESEIIRRIKNTNWQHFVSRPQAALFLAFSDECRPYFKKITGFKSPYQYTLRNFQGDILLSQETLDEAHDYFIKATPKQVENFRDRLVLYMDKLDVLSTQIERTDFSNVKSRVLVGTLKKLILHTLYGTCFLNPMPAVDRALTEKILHSIKSGDTKQKQEILGILTYPFKENFHTEEERGFYKLVLARKTKSFKKLLQSHLADHAWVGTRGWWWDRAWNEKFILNRINSFVSQKKNAKRELAQLNAIRKEKKAEFEKTVARLNLRKTALYPLILLAKDFAYLRTFRTDILYRSGFKTRSLYYEIAKRADFPQKDVVLLTDWEILKMAQSARWPISKKELKERKKGFGSFADGIKLQILSGKKWRGVIGKINNQKSQAQEISGNIAFPGKVRGRVVRVLTTRDIAKCQVGDVMVSVMTFPNFVPAMEKAAAFVTDEGGILCHAAIVSREMKKPCVIATKIATKVFKDGDMVEVDANKGIVRKIN